MTKTVVAPGYTIALDAFTTGYLECALWAGGQDGELAGKTFQDFSRESLEKCKAQCEKFQIDNAPALETYCNTYPESSAGHDLFLTRNHHGAGYLDRDGLEGAEQDLTTAAHALGEQDVVLGDDGQLHLEGGFPA